MKRLLIVFLCLILCLFAVSCAEKENPNNDDKTNNKTDSTTDVRPGEDGYVPNEDEDNSMFVYPENPGQYVVDYMREMATLEWTPKTTFQLYGKYQAWKYNLTYEVGQKYYGLPFLVDSRGSMQEFVGHLEDGVYVGGTSAHDCIGGACYDAVYVSLIQACPSIKFKSTEDMLPKNNTGLVAIGDWDINLSKRDTPEIIQGTQTDVMGKAYAELEPGDVLLKHVVVQDAGHARIVSEKPHIVYTSFNTIDISRSYVTAIEQTNLWDETASVNTTWWIDRKYTFMDLMNTYFVPLRPIDYVEKPDAPYMTTEDLIKADEIAEAKKLKGSIISNHYITEVEVSITNSNGVEIYNTSVYPDAKKVLLEEIKYSPKLYKYENGTYNFTLKASLPSGTKTLAEYSFEINY